MVKNSILNINVLSISLPELLEKAKEGVIFTTNVDHMVKLQKDKTFYKSYQEAEWIICDSKILNLAAHFLGCPFKEVIPGSSFFPVFYNYHKNNKNLKLFLFGAAMGVAEKAREEINSKIGWEMVIGAHSPSYGFESNEEECSKIVNLINDSGANVLIVGLGAPKQEKWIMKYRYRLPNVKLFMAVGATIDFESGYLKRAPVVYRKIYLEWYYRMTQEPRRLWRRYLLEDIVFFWYVLKQRLGVYKNPFDQP